MGLDETSTRIIRAVRAESARVGASGQDLAIALGRDKKYVYDRFRFDKAFSTDDLAIIAKRLGITTAAIWESAEFELRAREQAAA